MFRPCEVCGVVYEAKRRTSKYCGAKCRVKASRGYVTTPELANVVALGTVVPAEPEQGPTYAATLRELTEAERHDTALGEAALVLARRVDGGRDTGAGLAALVKQLEATLRSATSGATDEASALDKARDELAARRAKRA